MRKKTDTLRYSLSCLLLLLGLTVLGQDDYDVLLKARSLADAQKTGEAISLLNESVYTLKSVNMLVERGGLFLASGDYSLAIKDFNSANALEEGAGEYGLSKAYALKGDAATSVYHLALSMASKFKQPQNVVLLEPAFDKIEQSGEWRDFQKRDWYSKLEMDLSELSYDISVGNTMEAITSLKELKGRYPNETSVMYADALLDYSVGKQSSAIEKLSVILKDDPDDEQSLRLLAKAQYDVHNYFGAANTYSTLITSGVVDASFFFLRAKCLYESNDYENALADLERFIALYPADKNAVSLAGAAASASGDNIAALKYFSRNVTNNPDDPTCYTQRGDAYFMSKSWKLAADDYGLALDLDASNATVWFNQGMAYINMKIVDEGCHCLARAMRLGEKRAASQISQHCDN